MVVNKKEIIEAIDVFMKAKARAIGRHYKERGLFWLDSFHYTQRDRRYFNSNTVRQLRGAVKDMPLIKPKISSDMCMHCMIMRQGVVKNKCEKCFYAKVHGKCGDSDSSWFQIAKEVGNIADIITDEEWTDMVTTLKKSVLPKWKE